MVVALLEVLEFGVRTSEAVRQVKLSSWLVQKTLCWRYASDLILHCHFLKLSSDKMVLCPRKIIKAITYRKNVRAAYMWFPRWLSEIDH